MDARPAEFAPDAPDAAEPVTGDWRGRRLPARPAVGVLVPEFPSQTHVFFWREVQAWRAMGATVRLISTRRPPDEACRHDFAEQARQTTFYAWPPGPGPAAGLAARPAATARAARYVASASGKAKVAALVPAAANLRRWCRRNDVTHIHGHSCAGAAHLLALCRRLGGPSYSLTLHGDLSVYGSDHRLKLADCTAMGCDGPHLVPQLTAIGYPRDRVLPNWMGVDTDRHTPPATPRPVVPGRLRLVTVARLNFQKGHVFALEAVRRLVDEGLDITYDLVGEGEHRPQIERDVARLELGGRVRLLGSLGEAAVRDCLHEADAFCLPSIGLGEAGPISVMEACATGLPVVCSVIGSTPHMVADGETGLLVAQQDVDGLAGAFRTLAANPARRRAMGEAARAWAVQNFDSRATALRLWDHLSRWTPALEASG